MLATRKQASPGNSTQSKSQLAIIVAGIALIIGLLTFEGHHYLDPPTPSLAQNLEMDKHPFPVWVSDAAMQCKGDMSKLSPDMQQKLSAQFKDGGRTEIMASYAIQTH